MRIETPYDENKDVYNAQFGEKETVYNAQFSENTANIAVKGEETIPFNPLFRENDDTFDLEYGEIYKVYTDAPLYDGEYVVTPKVKEQTLPTAEKMLTKDVTIKKIPYFEVNNNSGGNTVYIGNEV